jgi:EAL domain-containing protein (putative c-di-GMP-specific phosphodiesterase class I)
MSQLSFSERVLPTIRTIIQNKDMPDNVTVALLDSIQHLREKATAKEFADGQNLLEIELTLDIMPLLYEALGKNAYLQEKALKIAGELTEHLDFITVKSALFPKVSAVFSHTTTLGTKILTLECFLALVPKLDNVSYHLDYANDSSQ